MHPLAHLIPTSNSFHMPRAIRQGIVTGWEMNVLESAYKSNAFVGCFLDQPDQPDWARRIARYNRDEFHGDSPHKKTRFADIDTTLTSGEGQVFVTFRHALDAWHAGGKKGIEPYTTQQDYGSCVDASCGEHESALLGWRAAQPQFSEEWKLSAGWYKYANRGYCGDGWDGAGCAAVARKVGVAFRTKYEIGGNAIDFTDDDQNENVVARQWCRTGIPKWLSDHTQKNHPYEDGAITEFDGDLNALRNALAAGGVIHTGGVKTSGGSRPFTEGNVGPHMQSIVGGDDSDKYRRFCQDVIGVSAREKDFPVVFMQTWGPGWSGECADRYWPSWWGHKPEGAWVVWASQALDWFRGDMFLWLPRVKGFARTTPEPLPPGPQPPGAVVVIGGRLNLTGPISIPAGETRSYVVVPEPKA